MVIFNESFPGDAFSLLQLLDPVPGPIRDHRSPNGTTF